MGPYDTEFLLLAHADRITALRRAAASTGRPRRPGPVRRRLGSWLVSAGFRLAAEPTPRTRAA